jgi:hypothetical protein
MGYHHCHIPDLQTLQTQYEVLGLTNFVMRYKNCQGIIGDSDAIKFIEDKINEFLNII